MLLPIASKRNGAEKRTINGPVESGISCAES
jgi:hypothetical protein